MNKYRELFLIFARISLFTVGGGLVMLPLVRREITEKRQWLSEKDFLDVFSIANSMPGVMIMNVAVTVGYRTAGKRGAAAAALGAVLPPFFCIVLAGMFFSSLKDLPAAKRIFSGVRPAAVGLILVPLIALAKAASLSLRKAWIPVAVAAALLAEISPVFIIFIAFSLNLLFLGKNR